MSKILTQKLMRGPVRCYSLFRREFKVPYKYNQIRNSEINLQLDAQQVYSQGIINFFPPDTINFHFHGQTLLPILYDFESHKNSYKTMNIRDSPEGHARQDIRDSLPSFPFGFFFLARFSIPQFFMTIQYVA